EVDFGLEQEGDGKVDQAAKRCTESEEHDQNGKVEKDRRPRRRGQRQSRGPIRRRRSLPAHRTPPPHSPPQPSTACPPPVFSRRDGAGPPLKLAAQKHHPAPVPSLRRALREAAPRVKTDPAPPPAR